MRHLIKRRDPKTVQKEREARAAAAAASAAPTAAVEEQEPEGVAPDENLVGEEAELPSGLSAEDIEDVPPAIEEVEEETIEA